MKKARFWMMIIEMDFILLPGVLYLYGMLLLFANIIPLTLFHHFTWLLPFLYLMMMVIYLVIIYKTKGKSIGKWWYHGIIKIEEPFDLRCIIQRECVKLLPIALCIIFHSWIILYVYVLIQMILIMITEKGIHDYLFHTEIEIEEDETIHHEVKVYDVIL